jgi:hypothetical protein
MLVAGMACGPALANEQAEKASKEQAGASSPLADPKDQPAFTQLDRDRDGYVSRTEAAVDKDLLVDFHEMDLTLDSKLSAAEYRSYYSAGYGRD